MAADGPQHHGVPRRLTRACQPAFSTTRWLHRPWTQPLRARLLRHRPPDGDCPARHAWRAVLWAAGLTMGLVLTLVCARAADTFVRLSAQEIRAKIIGKVITDDAHWSHHFRPNGTVHSIVLSQHRQGTWKIVGNTLCLTLKTRRDQSTECYEVWLWKDHVEYQQNGAKVMDGFVRKEWLHESSSVCGPSTTSAESTHHRVHIERENAACDTALLSCLLSCCLL
jgi:hypothetical protein